MKKTNLVLLLCLLLPLLSIAQANYRPGYVIKTNSDTLKGYIDYKEWNESPKSIAFKQNLTATPVTFNVPEIKNFQVTGLDNYVSYIGPVSTGKTNSADDLPQSLDTAVRLDSAFLKVISMGQNVQLLYHADKIKYRYFILENNGSKPYELSFYQYLDENNRIVSKAPFLDQIDLLLKKYNNSDINATGRISAEKYSEDVFIRYVRIINNNKSTEVSRSSSTRFFIGTGVAYTSGAFSGPAGFGYPTHASSLFPLVSIGVDFLSNASIEKSFFRVEVSLTNASPKFIGTAATFSSTQFIDKLSGKYIYNVYNTDKIKYYIGAGAAFTITTVTNSKLVANESGVVISPTAVQPVGNSYSSLQAGQSINKPYEIGEGGLDFQIKTGIILNKKIEINLETAPLSFGFSSNTSPGNSHGVEDVGAYSYKNRTTSIGFNYLFGAK